MKFPTIAMIALELREMSLVAKTDTRVLLRVAEDGSWALQAENEKPKVSGGHVSAVVIPGGDGKKRRFPSTELARDLIRDVKDAHTAHTRAEKDAKAAQKRAAQENRERRRRDSQSNHPPFGVGSRVKAGGVRGRVVGHGTVHGQLGPTHVHLIEVDDPQMVQQWNTYISIVAIADGLVKLDLELAAHPAVH